MQYLWRPEEGAGFTGTGVTRQREPPPWLDIKPGSSAKAASDLNH